MIPYVFPFLDKENVKTNRTIEFLSNYNDSQISLKIVSIKFVLEHIVDKNNTGDLKDMILKMFKIERESLKRLKSA